MENIYWTDNHIALCLCYLCLSNNVLKKMSTYFQQMLISVAKLLTVVCEIVQLVFLQGNKHCFMQFIWLEMNDVISSVGVIY